MTTIRLPSRCRLRTPRACDRMGNTGEVFWCIGVRHAGRLQLCSVRSCRSGDRQAGHLVRLFPLKKRQRWL